jgi:hypothetical protein
VEVLKPDARLILRVLPEKKQAPPAAEGGQAKSETASAVRGEKQ